jgi:hypothetical protein
MGGSSSSASTTSQQTTNNADNRVTNGNGLALASSSGNTITVQNSDAQTLQKIGTDAVSIYNSAGSTSAAMYDHTIDAGSKMMDKMLTSIQAMQQGNDSIASAAIAAFTPSVNKMTDTAKFVGVLAVGVAAVYVLRKK